MLSFIMRDKERGGDIMWTIEDIANYFQIHYTTVYERIINKKIKAIKVGVQWRSPEEEIERLKREGF